MGTRTVLEERRCTRGCLTAPCFVGALPRRRVRSSRHSRARLEARVRRARWVIGDACSVTEPAQVP